MKKQNGERRHDSLIDFVEAELKSRGFRDVYRNVNYNKNKCGEIDLYALRDGYVLLFEMKSTNCYKSRKKALDQLNRARLNCFRGSRVFSFYVSDYKNPSIEWIKSKELDLDVMINFYAW
jgi:Holliday junction resolvase-like predicted endonuclease